MACIYNYILALVSVWT